MPLLDFVKNLTQREKTKTKKRSDDNMYITKTKEVKIPLEGDMTKIVTKKVKRPTVLGKLGDVEDKKEVTRDVRYESNSDIEKNKNNPKMILPTKLTATEKEETSEEKKIKENLENKAREEWNNIANSAIEKNKSKKRN